MGSRDNAINGIKSAFVTVYSGAVIAALVAQFPVLAHPFAQWILKRVLNKALTKAADEGDVMAFFKYIDVRTNAQGVEFEKDATHLEYLKKMKAPKEEIARAEQKKWDSFKRFAKFVS